MSYFEIVALAEECFGDLEAVLGMDSAIHEEAQAMRPQADDSRYIRSASAAIVPVRGVLLDEWSMAGPWRGATGYNYIRAATEEAAADRDVAATVLDICSPGGMVSGMAETANAIERSGLARSGKPVFAVIRSYGASAAYGLACNADRVIASDSALVGSIGAKLMHVSLQRMFENVGIRVTEIASHPGKADASPFRDLSEPTRARLQASVDDSAQAFAQMVARRRRMSVEAVHALDAAVFPARSASGRKTAMDVGLVDLVAPADDTLAEILRQSRR